MQMQNDLKLCDKCQNAKMQKELCERCKYLIKNYCPDCVFICHKEIVGGCLNCWKVTAASIKQN